MRNYTGQFIARAIKLPTADFSVLSGRVFRNVSDEFTSAAIDFSQAPHEGRLPEVPYAQTYPVRITSIRFGKQELYALHAEVAFEVDFSAGPPHPWARRAAISPYHWVLLGAPIPNVAAADADAFVALVKRTHSDWSKARYSTHVRVLMNHRYQTSNGLNTHQR